jgi:hypothetical protein
MFLTAAACGKHARIIAEWLRREDHDLLEVRVFWIQEPVALPGTQGRRD